MLRGKKVVPVIYPAVLLLLMRAVAVALVLSALELGRSDGKPRPGEASEGPPRLPTSFYVFSSLPRPAIRWWHLVTNNLTQHRPEFLRGGTLHGIREPPQKWAEAGLEPRQAHRLGKDLLLSGARSKRWLWK